MKTRFVYIEFILLVLFLLPFSFISAQVGKVEGLVYDSQTKIPMESVIVRVMSLPDSVFIAGATTNEKGEFSLSLPRNHYVLRLSFFGYRTSDYPFDISDVNLIHRAGKLKMIPSDIQLKEVTVVGKQPGITVNNDTVEYHPDAFRTVKSAVVEDLLKKLPGVEIDQDGKIMINGQEITKIMIDGKEFFGDDPKVATKNLPVDIIERLQVVERKSDIEELTGIDDGQRQYVINLAIKPDKKKGFFGTAMAGGGTREKYEANGLINKFTDEQQVTALLSSNNTNNMGFSDILKGLSSQVASKASLSTQNRGILNANTVGANYSNVSKNKRFKNNVDILFANLDKDEERTSHRENFQTSGYNTVDRNQWNNVKSNQLKANARLDYSFNTGTRLIFTPKIIFGNAGNKETAGFKTFEENDLLLNRGDVNNRMKEDNYSLSGTLSVSQSLKKKGRRVTLSLTGSLSDTDIDAYTRTDKYKYRNEQEYLSSVTEQEYDRTIAKNEYRVRLFYVEPITKKLFLQTSYQFSRTYTQNRKNTFLPDPETGIFNIPYDAQTDRSETEFYRNRIEIGIRHILRRFNYTVGMVAEPAVLKGRSFQTDTISEVSKKVFNVAPYFELTWPFSKQRRLRFDYRSDTRQPSPNQLQPIVDNSNPNHIRSGNQNLKPSFYSRFRLRFNDYDKVSQRTLVSTLGVNIMQNAITNRTSYNEEGVQFTQPVNVKGVWDGYATCLYNLPVINNYFRLSTYTQLNYAKRVAFIGANGDPGVRSDSKDLRLRENLKLTYRNDWLEIGARSSFLYNYVRHSMQAGMDVDAWDWNNGADFEIRFPYDITCLIHYNYIVNGGYVSGYDKRLHLVDAEINMTVFKNKKGTFSLKGYDLLRQQRNISRVVRSTYIEDVAYNVQPRYVILQFTYRFNQYGKSKKE